MPEISFIILNYNGFDETSKLVQSMLKWDISKLDFNIVVVDNCSSDDSFERLKNAFNQIEYIDVIQSEHNGGYSYGNNFGAKFAIEKYNPCYLAIANPDIQIDQDAVIALLTGFGVNDKIAMTAPVMQNTEGGYKVCSQKLPTFYDDFRMCWTEKNPPSVMTDRFETIPGHENMILSEMLPGSFFVVKTKCFQEAGMFDDGVFLFCEERIIGKRLKDLGYKLILRSDLFFIHAHSVTIKKAMDSIKTWKIIWKSRIYYQKKYNKVNQLKLVLLRLGAWYFLQVLAVKSKLYNWKHAIRP